MTTQKYLVQAHGRRAGALGISYPLAVFVEAENANTAILEAYKHVEHLSSISVQVASEAVLDRRRELIETNSKANP